MPKRPVVPEDIRSIRFVDSVLPSPDGLMAVYEIRTINAEKDTYDTHLWMIPLAGGAPRQLTFGERRNSGATWSPDGRSIAFVSTRRDKVPQIYRLSLDGGRTFTWITGERDPTVKYFDWTVPNTPTNTAVLDIRFGCLNIYPETSSLQVQSAFVISPSVI